LLDYSKKPVTEEDHGLLARLAEDAGVKGWIEKMFTGEKINATEGPGGCSTWALRNRSNRPILVDARTSLPEVNEVLAKMRKFRARGPAGAVDGLSRASGSRTW